MLFGTELIALRNLQRCDGSAPLHGGTRRLPEDPPRGAHRHGFVRLTRSRAGARGAWPKAARGVSEGRTAAELGLCPLQNVFAVTGNGGNGLGHCRAASGLLRSPHTHVMASGLLWMLQPLLEEPVRAFSVLWALSNKVGVDAAVALRFLPGRACRDHDFFVFFPCPLFCFFCSVVVCFWCSF